MKSLRLLSLLALFFAGFAVPALATSAPATEAPKDTEETYRMLKVFGEVFERVRGQYVDEISDKQLIEYALQGMLSSLDPHSSYLNDESFEDMKVQTRGSFGGLGIEVTMENGLVKVVSPIDDTPAYKAGVKAGDLITHLDGVPVIGLTLNDAVDKMRGKVGTAIEITVRREGTAEALKFSITRDIIKIRSVRSSMYDNIGYIRITTFNAQTEPGLRDAIEKIQKEKGKDLLGYVIDLRNNPGGLLDQAIGVADDFLERGEIVSTRGRNEEDTKRDNATPGDLTGGLPVVVLINGGSASASEIVAGALQDHRRAVLIGTKSFGKGSVQTIISMPGNTAIRLTTARYYTPSGRSIQAKGIEPDIVVPQSKLELLEKGEGITEADLRGALSGVSGGRFEGKTPAQPDGSVTPMEGLSDEKKENKPVSIDHPELADDYQLARAVDLLKGIALYGSDHVPQGSPELTDAPGTDQDKPKDGASDAQPGKPEEAPKE
ncbi:MAG TPA: S41 family peptidase [Alphaproteobacteria bacterium]